MWLANVWLSLQTVVVSLLGFATDNFGQILTRMHSALWGLFCSLVFGSNYSVHEWNASSTSHTSHFSLQHLRILFCYNHLNVFRIIYNLSRSILLIRTPTAAIAVMHPAFQHVIFINNFNQSESPAAAEVSVRIGPSPDYFRNLFRV